VFSGNLLTNGLGMSGLTTIELAQPLIKPIESSASETNISNRQWRVLLLE
jgi:hypothetical protein